MKPILLQNVQTLRAVAALLVVLVHMTLKNVGIEEIFGSGNESWLLPLKSIGTFGVDLFFVISGFIMLVTNWEAFGSRHAGLKFLVRRVIRIYPPYWFAFIPVFIVLEFARDRYMVSHTSGQTGLIESFFLLPNPHQFVLAVGWTLVWEMVFYVVFSGLLAFQQRFIPVLLFGWYVVEVVLNHTLNHATNYYFLFASTSLPIEFILGSVVGLLYVKGRLPPTWLLSLGAICLTTVAFSYRILWPDKGFPCDPVYFLGIPAALIVASAVSAEIRLVFVSPRWMSDLGNGSYAVYLWHISVLVGLRQIIAPMHLHGPIAHTLVLVVTVLTITTVGQLIYYLFEIPITTYLNRWSRSFFADRMLIKASSDLRIQSELRVD